MKYLVMEYHPGYAVVLDEHGRFRKVANLRYEVGQTVSDVVEVTIPERRTVLRWLPVLSAVACLVLVIAASFFFGFRPYASVYVTINPEVRIDVDRKDMVVGLEGVNADGVTLLEGYDYRKKDLNTVMEQLVDRAVEMGFLYEGGTITLELDAENQLWITEHETVLMEQLHAHFQEHMTVHIEFSGCEHDHNYNDHGDDSDEEHDAAHDDDHNSNVKNDRDGEHDNYDEHRGGGHDNHGNSHKK